MGGAWGFRCPGPAEEREHGYGVVYLLRAPSTESMPYHLGLYITHMYICSLPQAGTFGWESWERQQMFFLHVPVLPPGLLRGPSRRSSLMPVLFDTDNPMTTESLTTTMTFPMLLSIVGPRLFYGARGPEFCGGTLDPRWWKVRFCSSPTTRLRLRRVRWSRLARMGTGQGNRDQPSPDEVGATWKTRGRRLV